MTSISRHPEPAAHPLADRHPLTDPRLLADPHPLADPRVLVGRWRLRRTVADLRLGRAGCVHGTLVVSPVVDARGLSAGPGLSGKFGPSAESLSAESMSGLRWAESGTLTWSDVVRPVSRTYLLVPTDAAGWDVLFADGRDFHPWRPGEQVQHACGADVYLGLVDGGALAVRLRWEVRGPSKHQILRTTLRKDDTCQPAGSVVM